MESQLRSTVITMLKELDAVPVENPVCPGTPDVNCSLGWIELKEDQWTGDDRLRLNHWTPQQRVWLRRRADVGGLAVLLVRIRETGEWILMSESVARHAPGKNKEWFL